MPMYFKRKEIKDVDEYIKNNAIIRTKLWSESTSKRTDCVSI